MAAVSNGDGVNGSVIRSNTGALHAADDLLSLNDLAENDVLTVQPVGGSEGDEELRAVGVGTSVGHGEKVGLGVSADEGLILELGTVDGFATSTVSGSEVATLQKKKYQVSHIGED